MPPVRGPGASQLYYKHPWSSFAHTSSELLLPCSIGVLFEDDGVTHRGKLMGELAMQTLAMGGACAAGGGVLAPGALIPPAVLPAQRLLLAALLHAPPLIVVVRVRCPALSVQLPLEPADRFAMLRFRGEIRAKFVQASLALLGQNRIGRGTQVGSHRTLASLMLGFVERNPFDDQLHRVAKAVAVCPAGPGTARPVLEQAHIFDPAASRVGDDRIVPVDAHPKLEFLPADDPCIAVSAQLPLFPTLAVACSPGSLCGPPACRDRRGESRGPRSFAREIDEREAQPGIVALVFNETRPRPRLRKRTRFACPSATRLRAR